MPQEKQNKKSEPAKSPQAKKQDPKKTSQAPTKKKK